MKSVRNAVSKAMIREAAKKKFSGPATKRRGGGKGPASKEKRTLKKYIYIF